MLGYEPKSAGRWMIPVVVVSLSEPLLRMGLFMVLVLLKNGSWPSAKCSVH